MRAELPTSDGKISWAIYHKQLEAVAEANFHSEKSTALVIALRVEASEVLQGITDEEQKGSPPLIERLELRYGDHRRGNTGADGKQACGKPLRREAVR